MKKTLLLAISAIAIVACNNPKPESNSETMERENPSLLTSFELQNAASGIYIIEVHTDKGIGMEKVIVE